MGQRIDSAFVASSRSSDDIVELHSKSHVCDAASSILSWLCPMSAVLLPLLITIAQATSAPSYIEAQDKALAAAREHYQQLRAEALSNHEPAIRMEALGLVELLSEPDAEALLLKSTREDPDPAVVERAKALLIRATVARNARSSGQMSETQYQTYRASSRRLWAEAMFRPATSAPEIRR